MTETSEKVVHPDLREAFAVWARIGVLSFGGPAGQIALMHRIVVEEKRWISDARFLHALNYCMLLPGPEAQQLATYIGWLVHGVRGGVIAGMLFILPGLITVMGLSMIYATLGNVGVVEGLFFGLKAAVLAIVVQAVLRIGTRVLVGGWTTVLAILAFLAIFVFGVPFPLVIAAAAAIGLIAGRRAPAAFTKGATGQAGSGTVRDEDTLLGAGAAAPDRSGPLRSAAICLAIWLLPVAALYGLFGADDVFARIAGFFSTMAVVTFGGAYAALAYVAQEAVESFGWLRPGEMLDGLGLAETTPGPLILVTQFVGFMGAYRDPGAMPPLVAGTLGGLLTSWVTFAPCFFWIFLGAPFIERLRQNGALTSALTAITAAVVGVMANLAVWFGLHVLFGEVRTVRAGGLALDWPVWSTLDPASALLVAAALVAALRFKLGILPLLGGAAGTGLLLWGAGLAAV
ncbi:chromate efflux transporter [Tropicimonas sp. IMCC34011]|uniref:chromate efflux transporter n=1 Tax=Tropicimonas sp. IMCC34011 TaxID=2248759 RepID=UPI000E224FFE|nr:chromate efflux transporter [Tropicimonas sp. IMCC34011]